MDIAGATALVTGANRGIGRGFTEELLERGARRVYATARRPELIDTSDPRVVPLHLDLLDEQSVHAAAEAAPDVTLLVNNAGITTGADLLTSGLDEIRQDLETHLFGTLRVIRAFAPVLAAHSGGAIVNVLSVLSWVATPEGSGFYSVAKAAEWNMTNGVRVELAGQRTLVQGVHLGAADTDMTAGREAPKISPADVARAGLDGVQAGAIEVLADAPSRYVKAALAGDPAALYGAAR
ncbi:SDR family oxidoreductase [Streptomyces albidoflavus]|uniref:SDR family oxidoreductase n=1 Tax=Streptomyces albidoflavus TaxID=1886 RepID=UPI0033BE12D4